MTGVTGYKLQKCSSCGFWFSASLDGVCPNCECFEALWWSVSDEQFFFNKSTSQWTNVPGHKNIIADCNLSGNSVCMEEEILLGCIYNLVAEALRRLWENVPCSCLSSPVILRVCGNVSVLIPAMVSWVLFTTTVLSVIV